MKRSRAFPGGEPVQNTGIYAALRRTEGSRGIILDSNVFFANHASESRTSAFMLPAGMLFYSVFRIFGRMFPGLREWATNTDNGVPLLLFVFFLMTTVVAVLLALLPVHKWAFISILILFYLISVALLYKALSQPKTPGGPTGSGRG